MKMLWSFLLGAAIPLLLAAVLLLTGVLHVGGAGRIEGRGFGSPEEAVRAFGKYLQKGDLDGMLSTFAIESCVEHQDLEELFLFQGYNTDPEQFFDAALPADNPLAERLDLEGRRASVSLGIGNLLLYLQLKDSPYRWNSGAYFLPPRSEDETEEILSLLSRDGMLRSMTVLDAACAEDLLSAEELSEKFVNRMERQSRIHGADEFRYAALRVRIDDAEYFICFSVVRYGDRWFNLSLDPNFSNLLNRNALTPFAIVPAAGVGR